MELFRCKIIKQKIYDILRRNSKLTAMLTNMIITLTLRMELSNSYVTLFVVQSFANPT